MFSADEIDFKIYGSEMQFVEIELDPGESTVAEAGAMMCKDATIDLSNAFGDEGFIMQKLEGDGLVLYMPMERL